VTRRSLRFRLLAAAFGSIGLALLLAGLGLTALFERHVERRLESQLDDDVCQILGHIKAAQDGRIQFDLALADPRFDLPLSGLYWQIRDEDRPTLLRSRSLWDAVLELPGDVLADGVLHRHQLAGPGGETLLVLERQVRFRPDSENRRLRVAVAIDRRELAEAGRAFAADMLPYLILLGAVLMIAAWAQVRIGLAPLDRVRRGLRSIRSGEARRLAADHPDEVDPLVQEVNALLDAQEGAIERARGWTTDLAHGLKTPLVVLAADAERLRAAGQPELADDLDGLAQTMRQRVDRELIRARIRARAPSPADAERVPGAAQGALGEGADLPAVLDQVVHTLQRTPNGARLDWRLDGPEALRVRVLPEDLTELLGNVLENAATWARSRVSIRISGVEPVVVRVEDDGPGVPEEALQALVQRGLRLDERTQGTGLGLAIAQDICDAYGVELGFAAGVPGPAPASPGTAKTPPAERSGSLGGLVVTLRLPGARRTRSRSSR
jgi:signal transduction histidine kinase